MTRRLVACAECSHRSWLVHRLGGRLAVRRYGVERLVELFALPDDQLLAALGFRSAADLDARCSSRPRAGTFRGTEHAVPLHAVCQHDSRYPGGPKRDGTGAGTWSPPPVLRVAGDIDRLRDLERAPVVAIVGTRRGTDYGLAVAYRSAFELGASGVTVLGALAEGVASAAHAGALSAGAGTITVMASGADRPYPAARRSLYLEILRQGCAVSETPFGAPPCRWAHVARGRIVAGLASLVLVVEAEENITDLALPRFAQALGRRVVAVPGRVTSAASAGTHLLIAQGAPIARHAQDVLDELYGVGAAAAARAGLAERRQLGPAAAQVLALVARGADTPDLLVSSGVELQRALAALSELELAGELVRGDGGRYLPSRPCARASRAGL